MCAGGRKAEYGMVTHEPAQDALACRHLLHLTHILCIPVPREGVARTRGIQRSVACNRRVHYEKLKTWAKRYRVRLAVVGQIVVPRVVAGATPLEWLRRKQAKPALP